MPHDLDPEQDQPQPHRHNCGSLFGCGEENGTGVVREDLKDAAFNSRAADRLRNMDEISQERLDGFLNARGLPVAGFARSSFLARWRDIGPWFNKLARARPMAGWLRAAVPARRPRNRGRRPRARGGEQRQDSSPRRIRHNLEPILKVDSGDTISYVNTWTHFLNQLQPGVPVDFLAKQRLSNPGKGPHSIIGPIYVNGAEPGDVLEVRYKRICPLDWAAVFNNPGTIGTGLLLAKDFPEGQVKYLKLDLANMTAEFNPRTFMCRSSPFRERWAWLLPMVSFRAQSRA